MTPPLERLILRAREFAAATDLASRYMSTVMLYATDGRAVLVGKEFGRAIVIDVSRWTESNATFCVSASTARLARAAARVAGRSGAVMVSPSAPGVLNVGAPTGRSVTFPAETSAPPGPIAPFPLRLHARLHLVPWEASSLFGTATRFARHNGSSAGHPCLAVEMEWCRSSGEGQYVHLILIGTDGEVSARMTRHALAGPDKSAVLSGPGEHVGRWGLISRRNAALIRDTIDLTPGGVEGFAIASAGPAGLFMTTGAVMASLPWTAGAFPDLPPETWGSGFTGSARFSAAFDPAAAVALADTATRPVPLASLPFRTRPDFQSPSLAGSSLPVLALRRVLSAIPRGLDLTASESALPGPGSPIVIASDCDRYAIVPVPA